MYAQNVMDLQSYGSNFWSVLSTRNMGKILKTKYTRVQFYCISILFLVF